MDHMDWDRIPGPAWYLPEVARAVMEALARSANDRQAARALADLRYAVTNDHAGTLVADDPSGGGGHRLDARLLLARLDEGWNTEVG